MASGEMWFWTPRPKSSPEQLIGCIWLRRGENHNRGFWLGLHWGQGLGSEAAEVVTDFWFDELGFSVLRVPKAIANTASRRISEKQGMGAIGTDDRIT
jgi:RimJ/RimL family protein N-acetyltransferase